MIERLENRRREAGEGGFTLIELLVVITILGILSAVVVFAVSGIGDKGQTSACRMDTRTLATAEEAYLASPGPLGGNGQYTDSTTLFNNGFLSNLPVYHEILPANVDNSTTPPSYTITVKDSRCA